MLFCLKLLHFSDTRARVSGANITVNPHSSFSLSTSLDLPTSRPLDLCVQQILSTIPDEVQNRTRFLGIIRRIAESIKEMLDAVNSVATNNADLIASKAEVR